MESVKSMIVALGFVAAIGFLIFQVVFFMREYSVVVGSGYTMTTVDNEMFIDE